MYGHGDLLIRKTKETLGKPLDGNILTEEE